MVLLRCKQVNFSSQSTNVLNDEGVTNTDSKATLTVDSPSMLVPWQAIPKLVSFFEDFNFFYLAYHKQRTAADEATRAATAALAKKAKAARVKLGKKIAKGRHQYFVKVGLRSQTCPCWIYLVSLTYGCHVCGVLW